MIVEVNEVVADGHKHCFVNHRIVDLIEGLSEPLQRYALDSHQHQD